MKKQLFVFLLVLGNFTLFALNNPITGIYEIDAGHTYVSFSVERFGMVMVTGQFTEVAGTVEYNPENVTSTKASINIAVNSLYSGHETRDGHLKGATWLDAENHPEIKFETTSLEEKEGQLIVSAHLTRMVQDKKITVTKGQLIVSAHLTIHGTTKDVAFPVEIKGPYKDPTKKTTIAISGDVVINRQDFGIVFNKTLDNGKLFIGNEVHIHFDALAGLKK